MCVCMRRKQRFFSRGLSCLLVVDGAGVHAALHCYPESGMLQMIEERRECLYNRHDKTVMPFMTEVECKLRLQVQDGSAR